MTSISRLQGTTAEAAKPGTPRTQRPLMRALSRLRRSRSALVGLSILATMVFIALFAPLLAPYNPTQVLGAAQGYVGQVGGRGPCIPAWNNFGCPPPPSQVATVRGPGVIVSDPGDGAALVLNDQASILQADVAAGANIAHAVGAVLQPPADAPPYRPRSALGFAPNLGLAGLLAEPDFSTLAAILDTVDMTEDLAANVPFTLFAPTNAAWEAYFAEANTTLEAFVADAPAARALLAYHVLRGRTTSARLGAIAQAEHPTNVMGIDRNSRDLFSRVLHGARVSLTVGTGAVLFAIVTGTGIGLVAGYAGGWADNIIMRVMDVLLAFPSLLLAIAIVTILGPGLQNALLAIAIVSIPQYARLVRASVLSLKEQEFISAERALGAGPTRIVLQHLLPNALTPIIVQGTLGVGGAIIEAAALSFLGLGAQPPTPEWGLMLAEGRDALRTMPHLMFFPGLAVIITVLGFNLLGDGMRDAFDPRTTQR